MALDGLFEIRVTTFRYEKRQLPRGRIIITIIIIIYRIYKQLLYSMTIFARPLTHHIYISSYIPTIILTD